MRPTTFSLLALLVAALVILLIYVLNRLRRQRRALTPQPVADVKMNDIWSACVAETKDEAASYTLATELDDVALDAIRGDLLEFEARLGHVDKPLQIIRQELMQAVDRRMLNTQIMELPDDVRQRLREQTPDVPGSDAEANRYIVANELRLQLLREYSARRFGDRADRDWFVIYEEASRLKQRSARDYIERALAGADAPAADSRYQAMVMVDGQLRSRLLQVLPGTSFKRKDDDTKDATTVSNDT